MQLLFGDRIAGNINLAAQILIIIGLWTGFFFARKKQFKRHSAIQTSMVLANMFFILTIMVTSFYSYVIRGGTTVGTVAYLMIFHGILGTLAELTGLYLILRMNTSLIPPKLRVKNYKLVMRSLLGLWTLLVLGGFAIYYERYITPASPALTPAAQLLQASNDLQIHAGEMQEALQRSDLSAARRHAEHLINLVEGKHGPDYGDADGDGKVEDPGDGTGSVVYLDNIMAAGGKSSANSSQAAALAGQIKTAMLKVLADAKGVIAAKDVPATASFIGDAVSLTAQIKNGPGANVTQLVQALGLDLPAEPSLSTTSQPAGAQAATVILKDFVYSPRVLTVKKGTTVTFRNLDKVKHTVTSDSGFFDSGDMDTGQSFTHTFDQVGTFPYYCVFHGDKGGVDMAGVIQVEP
jgi:plastocyanin/uncharacterized membrane protein YozB (DUF420 family)